MRETKAERLKRKFGVTVTQRQPNILSHRRPRKENTLRSRPPRRQAPGTQRNLIADAIRRRMVQQFGVTCTNCFGVTLQSIAKLSVTDVVAQTDELAKALYENAKEKQDRGSASMLAWADYKTNGFSKFAEIITEACQPYLPKPVENATPFLPGTRHFLYHIAPFAQSDMWRLNVAHCLKRMWLFNGVRSVAIVTGEGLADSDEVKAAFGGAVTNFIVMPNSERLREVATFVPLLEQVRPYQDDVTFYAHAKGVTRPVNEGVTCHPWTEILYETNLDYYPLVSQILERHPMAGSMKKVGRGFRGSASTWHYSGTYYWFRNRDVFARAWNRVDQVWWGTESWPGIMFTPNEAGCIFHQGTVPKLNLYHMPYLTRTILPELDRWKAEHSSERLVI